VLAQPAAGSFVVGACLRDELPELPRVIHAPEVHELVDHHVVANPWRHAHQPPVQADVSGRRARSPAPALIANADPRDGQAVRGGQLQQPRRQLTLRPRACFTLEMLGCRRNPRCSVALQLLPLFLDPAAKPARKGPRFAHRSPARQRDAYAAVLSDRDHVAARTRMARENDGRISSLQRCQGCQRCQGYWPGVEGKAGLHPVQRSRHARRRRPRPCGDRRPCRDHPQ
jgi:hypothetical protein